MNITAAKHVVFLFFLGDHTGNNTRFENVSDEQTRFA